MGAAKQQGMLEPGARAPLFQLEDLSGGTTHLRDLLAKGPVLLAFFKVSCPVCQLAFPFLERIHRGRGLAIYGVSQDDATDTRGFNETFGIAFPTLLDTEERNYPASNGFNIAHVPSLFLIEGDGTISWTLEGFGRKDLEDLGAKAGVRVFRPDDHVPEWKSG